MEEDRGTRSVRTPSGYQSMTVRQGRAALET